MSYHYDEWGWYDGEVARGSDRSTEIAPPDSKDDFRPNWTGHEWILQEYKAPPVQAEPVDEKADLLAQIDALRAKVEAL